MKKLLFVLITVTISFSACKKTQDAVAAPQAAFSTNIVTGKNPLEKDAIQLINNSTDNNFYAWDFGNGTTSIEKNPSVEYKIHGTYTIKLNVTNSAGLTTTTSHDVTILCRYLGGDHNAAVVL